MTKRNNIKQHLIHGIKTGVASLLAYGFTESLKIPNGYWAVITTVIVMQVYVADSISMCIYRFTGTAIGAVIGIGAVLVFPETPLWTVVSLFLTTSFCSFMTKYNQRYRMAAITVVIVILASLGVPDRVSFALSRVLEIGIGIFSASLVSILIVPAKRIDVLKNNLEEQAHEIKEKYNLIVDSFVNNQKYINDHILDKLTEKVWQNHEIYQMIMRHEALIYKKKVHKNLALLIATMGTSLEHLRTMLKALDSVRGKGFKIIMGDEIKKLAKVTGDALMSLYRGDKDFDYTALEIAMKDADIRLKSLRAEGVTLRFDIAKLTQVFAFYHSMHCLALDILRTERKKKENG